MSDNVMQALHEAGLNPFAVTLLAESMLRSSYVRHRGTKPLTFEFPVRRTDCARWVGVRITIEAIPDPPPQAACPFCGVPHPHCDSPGAIVTGTTGCEKHDSTVRHRP